MTGQKNRFSTTEKLWDLDDKQLKTPRHDAMVLWLMDKNNGQQIINFKTSMHKKDYWESDLYYTLKNIKVITEVPIYANKNFIGGYADLIYRGFYDVHTILKNGDDDGVHETFESKLIEVKPYIDSFGAVLRQINSYKKMIEEATQYNSSSRLNTHIEEYYIFTLDDRFDAQFESQDINMLHPPENVTIDDMVNMYL